MTNRFCPLLVILTPAINKGALYNYYICLPQSATSSLCSLRAGRQQLKKEGNDLIDFFCEDIDSFKLDDCFSIFHTFCLRFTNAVKVRPLMSVHKYK